jgi:protein-tyrosine-phosphatase
MAEGIFNAMASQDEEIRGNFEAASAGVAALEGEPASSGSTRALKELYGIDLSGHRAKNISDAMIKNAYLILTMTASHKEMLLEAFPLSRDRVFTLKEYVLGPESGCSPDISDPYGMPAKVYEQCAAEIREIIGKLVLKLKENRDF